MSVPYFFCFSSRIAAIFLIVSSEYTTPVGLFGVFTITAFVFAVIFVGMGVYFLRYFERQRRLDNMTEEERAQFFANGGAILMPHEVERLNREKEEKEGFVKKSEH